MEGSYIQEILRGDVSKFGYFVERYKDMAYSIAVRIVDNHWDAQEIVQDAFLKAYKSLHKFKRNSKFSTWFYKIVVNTALSRLKVGLLKAETTTIEEISDTELEHIESAYREYSNTEQKKLINAALDKLGIEDRLLLTLYYLNENTITEVHEITGIRTENIKMKLFRARKKMFLILNNSMEYN